MTFKVKALGLICKPFVICISIASEIGFEKIRESTGFPQCLWSAKKVKQKQNILSHDVE